VTRYAKLVLLVTLPLLAGAEGAAGTAATAEGGTAPAAAEAQPGEVPPVSTAIAGPQLLAEDLRAGAGQEAIYGTAVAVHYTGWLQDKQAPGRKGRQFDSSRGRNAFVFPLGGGRVIKGWDLGVIGMKVGGLRRLTIPPELGYGSQAVGGGLIPANSTLIFEVELLAVESVRDVRGNR
jgi:FKBP-type peptidyl-prolyl cis-trans isomerase FkpA